MLTALLEKVARLGYDPSKVCGHFSIAIERSIPNDLTEKLEGNMLCEGPDWGLYEVFLKEIGNLNEASDGVWCGFRKMHQSSKVISGVHIKVVLLKSITRLKQNCQFFVLVVSMPVIEQGIIATFP